MTDIDVSIENAQPISSKIEETEINANIEETEIKATIEDAQPISVTLEDAQPISVNLNAGGNYKTFLKLTDTPLDYTGQTGKTLKVNAGEDALEFSEDLSTTTWGDIIGTLTDQTDLSTALGLKYDSTDFNTDWDTRLGTKSTTDLSEGTNKYYTEARVSANTDVAANTDKTGITSAQATAITANTLKYTNVTTDLTAGTRAPTTIDVNSSDGTNATLVEADTTNAGILSSDKWDEIVVNTNKTSDINHFPTSSTTDLSEGTNKYYTEARVSANTDVAANTDKVTDVDHVAISSVDALNDVDTTTDIPGKNEVLKWNGSGWVPAVYNASFTFSIASFSDAQTSPQEIGTGVWKAIGAISFTASYNNGPADATPYVSHSAWSNLDMTGAGYVGPTTNAEAVSYAAVGSYVLFTLHATDGETSPTSNQSVYFYNKRHWGISTTASSYSSADIGGLANNELSNSKAKTFSVTAGVSNYIIYAYPSRLGTSTFYVGGFEGGFEAPETVSRTNDSSYVENYYVYRSTNSNLGLTEVTVV